MADLISFSLSCETRICWLTLNTNLFELRTSLWDCEAHPWGASVRARAFPGKTWGLRCNKRRRTKKCSHLHFLATVMCHSSAMINPGSRNVLFPQVFGHSIRKCLTKAQGLCVTHSALRLSSALCLLPGVQVCIPVPCRLLLYSEAATVHIWVENWSTIFYAEI